MASESKSNQEIVLAQRPEGLPAQTDFRVQKADDVETTNGHLLLESKFVSVDPYLRGRVREHKLGEVLVSGTVAQVIESKHPDFAVGDFVVGYLPWRRRIVSDGKGGLRKIDPAKLGSVSNALGVMGMPAMSAYFGLLDVAALKPTDVVVVSGAGGAVGSIAGQIARLKGCHVVGIAGSDDKCKWLVDELGFNTAINYKKFPTAEAIKGELAAVCPNGVDVYFDNTGGPVTDAMFDLLNKHGRVAVCGQISMYNATETPMAPLFLHKLIYKSVTVRGFVVADFVPRVDEFQKDMGAWIAAGKIKSKETVYHGFAGIITAFIGLFKGENTGKAVVAIDD